MTDSTWAPAGPSEAEMSVEDVANLLVAFRSAPSSDWRKGSPEASEVDAPREASADEATGAGDEAEISAPSGSFARKPRGQRAPKTKLPSKNRIDLSATTIEEVRFRTWDGMTRSFELPRLTPLRPAAVPQRARLPAVDPGVFHSPGVGEHAGHIKCAHKGGRGAIDFFLARPAAQARLD